VFAKPLKLTISSVMSICLSVRMVQLGYNCTVFYEFWNWSIIRKSVQEIQVRLQSEKNNAYFTWRPMYIYVTFCLILLRMRHKLYRKSKHIFCSKSFLMKVVPFVRLCEKARKNLTDHRRQYKTRHAHCMLSKKSYTNTHAQNMQYLLIALPRQRWLCKRVWLLCLFSLNG
jgi:hypothetical protein